MQEAAPTHMAAPTGDAPDQVEMPRNFRQLFGRRGMVAQHDTVQQHVLIAPSTQGSARKPIVIARDPVQIDPLRQGAKPFRDIGHKPFHARHVVKAVAQRPEFLRVGPVDQAMDPLSSVAMLS